MTKWIETTEERYDEMLGTVTLAYWSSIGFLVGEPMDHYRNGQPRFSAFVRIGKRYFGAVEPLTIAQFRSVSSLDVLKAAEKKDV